MPFPLKIRILGGPILGSQRVKIDLEGDYTFADLYYYIRRQMPKILSEDEASRTLAITPENYDLLFVDVQEGRAKPLEMCDPNQRVRDANWICPALMLKVRDSAIRTVLRAESQKQLLNSSGSGGKDPLGASSSSFNPNGTFNRARSSSVQFASPTPDDDEGRRFGLDESQTRKTLQRIQSTYTWSDNSTRLAASEIQLPSSTGNPNVNTSTRTSSREEDLFPMPASGSLPSTPGDALVSPSALQSALTAQRSGSLRRTTSPELATGDLPFSSRGPTGASTLDTPAPSSSATAPTTGKSPMRSAWKKLSNVVTAASPVKLKEFGLNIPEVPDDGPDGVMPLRRRQSSLTAQLADLPEGMLPMDRPNYAHDGQVQSYRERLLAILALYDPKSLRKIDRILARSQGKEEQLLQLAILKYGPEPKYSNVARDGAFVQQHPSGTNLSGAWLDGGAAVMGARRNSIGEEVLRRATMTHANSLVHIDDDGIVTYRSQFRDLVEFLFEEYDFLTPTAVGLFLQRVQENPKCLAANLALHMNLYKYLRLNVEREDQLVRRQVQRQLFVEQHHAHVHTRACMWFSIYCMIERRRFEGMHLILRASIPPQYFLGWLYLQRHETYAWETCLRLDLERRQLLWFHAFQRTFYDAKESVLRRATLVSHRASLHFLQRSCYADRESVRRGMRAAEEYHRRCILEQYRDMERESYVRIVHHVETTEALDRRCEEFAYTSTAFDIPIRMKRFVERCFRELYEVNEVEGRMRVVQYISQRRAWIVLEQKYVLATEELYRSLHARTRQDFMEKRFQQFLFGLDEADKRTLNVHFEMGCRWRILQRRWMNKETVVRNETVRQWMRDRMDMQSKAIVSLEDAARRTMKRFERTQNVQVRMEKMTAQEEPEGRWFHIFGESANFRHYQRQYLFWQESTARRELQLYGLCRLFWMLESKRRGDIEIREQETIVLFSSGGNGSMEAVRRQAIELDALRGLFLLFQREMFVKEELLRRRMIPTEWEARQRIFRRGIYEGEDERRRALVRGAECAERETLARWHKYQQEYFQRVLHIYYWHHLSLHAITAKAVVRYREQRDRIEDIKEPLERGNERILQELERHEIEIKELVHLEDVKRKAILKSEKHDLRLPLYGKEKEERDRVERLELNGEEQDRRIYWKMFELFTWERIPRLEIQYGQERKLRSALERRHMIGIETITRGQMERVDWQRGFNLIAQRRLADLERVVRKFTMEPLGFKYVQVIERQMFQSVEEIARMNVVEKWASAIHIFEQRSVQLFYFVVRSHTRHDEYLSRKFIERERLVDQEESIRRKMRNAALASLTKWWQKTNLQARQDVIAYANKLQREDDNRVARESAQKRIEERLAARVAEKIRATLEAKHNQIVGIVIGDETRARSVIWEDERNAMHTLLHDFSEAIHSTNEMYPSHVKAKQKLLKVVQGLSKIVKAAPSLEQFISMLPPMVTRRRKSKQPSSTTDDDEGEEQQRHDNVSRTNADLLGEMNLASVDDGDDNDDPTRWQGASEDRQSLMRGASVLLPPIRTQSTLASSLSPQGGSRRGAGGSGNSREALRGGDGDDTVPSDLFAQSPASRPGIHELRGSSATEKPNASNGASRSAGKQVAFHSPNNVSVSQVGLKFVSDDEDEGSDNDNIRLPPL